MQLTKYDAEKMRFACLRSNARIQTHTQYLIIIFLSTATVVTRTRHGVAFICILPVLFIPMVTFARRHMKRVSWDDQIAGLEHFTVYCMLVKLLSCVRFVILFLSEQLRVKQTLVYLCRFVCVFCGSEEMFARKDKCVCEVGSLARKLL
jgi:hypothetical protein